MRLLKIIYLSLIILISVNSEIRSQTYEDTSVLSSGIWYKYRMAKKGVVKIAFDQLEPLGLPEGTVPSIYGNNFGLLSYLNSEPYPDDLKPVPLYIEKGGDGIFNSGDYIIFYVESPHRWAYSESAGYSFLRHNYSDSAAFFLTWSKPFAEISVQALQSAPNGTSQYKDHLSYHEVEKVNLIKSGREWYEPVSYLQALPLNDINLGSDLQASQQVKFKLRVFARSADMTSFRLNSGSSTIVSTSVSGVDISSSTGTYAREALINGEFDPAINTEALSLEFYNNGDGSAKGWLDYLLVQSRRKMIYNGEPLYIRDHTAIGSGNLIEYKVEAPSENLFVWDITDSDNPVMVNTVFSNGILSFISSMDTLHTFLVFDPSTVQGPGQQSIQISNQNLHDPGEYDGIIVTHSLFSDQAKELADIHFQHDGLNSLIVTPEEIYNEFSGGIPDISAIRNFVRMVYSRNKDGQKPLRYLTLFGDGSFHNKSLPPNNPNFIPTYQTQNSHVIIQSYTSDDYYGLLDEGEGEAIGYIDIGIGRLPVSDIDQANILIQKTRSYIDPANMGSWRNMVLMIADDEDSNTHLNDAEGLVTLLESEAPEINIDKVYFDSYTQTTTINGESYPDVTEAINDRMKAGCLIFNYLGHGNELGLAHERVVKIDDINSWTNINKLPVFITATCEFSRFDDIDMDPGSGDITQKSSAGELVLLSGSGGGIALMTTTRIVYSAPNYTLNNRIYKYAFTLDSEGNGLALGDILRLAKNDAGSGANKRNFTLLGDPAIKLAYPWHGTVVTDSINGVPSAVFNDTIKALSELSIKGHVINSNGDTNNNFNGLLNTVIYDKKYEISTQANDGGSSVIFDKQDRSLFRGTTEIVNGEFEIKTIIPRDIDYTFEKGKVSYYASSGSIDYTGSNSDLLIGGFSDLTANDTTGPLISLSLNDTLFRSGGITNTTPILLAQISDESGINTSGVGIGHDIITYLDNDKSISIILNNFYENRINSFTSGIIEYPLEEFEKGKHYISLKAWDNYNNSSTESIVFIVESEDGLILNRLINYPNPFISDTRISLDHNRPGVDLDIEISIFSSKGSLIKKLKTQQTTSGFSLNPIIWDGIDDRGTKVGRGLYVYSVYIKTSDGKKARITGKMVIL
jgi:hypothetical protein